MQEVMQVVNTKQVACNILLRDRMQIGSGVFEAGLAFAVFLYRLEVLFVFLILHTQFALACENGAESSRPSGEHTIEHVDSQTCADDDINKITHPHQIARLVCW
jgi:hypothetical protein